MAAEKAKPPRTGPGSRTGENARSGPSQLEEDRVRKNFVVRLSPEERAALAQLAARWGVSQGAAVVRAVAEALARAD